MEKNVCIVNFNTPELTSAAILSLWKNTPDAKVTVFDNSDTRPFPAMDGVTIIDNTKGQIIDFDEFLSRFPDKKQTRNEWGSAKHTYTVDRLFDYFPEGFVLMDSDVLVRKDISCFFDKDYACCGEVGDDHKSSYPRVPRLFPFVCWLNVPVLKENGIHYFDNARNWLLTSNRSVSYYDTGASFIEDVIRAGLSIKEININEYIVHLGSGSWKDRSCVAFLEKYKNLYSDMKKDDKTEAKEKYLVVIPFFSGGAQGREIEYAVAGWRRHFKEPYLIVVVGDHHPVCDTGDDIVFIECSRVPEQKYENYRPHIDFVKKFKAVHEHFPDSKGFIFVADDVYAVNDFDFWDVACLKANTRSITYPDLYTPWNREKHKTINLLKKEGYPIVNFTTHLPVYFEWDKLEALWDKYDMEHNSYIIEDLYFNIYYPTRIPIMLHIDWDNFKCGVYRKSPRLNYIDNAFKTKIWLQNSVDGWIPYLDKKLAEYYGL